MGGWRWDGDGMEMGRDGMGWDGMGLDGDNCMGDLFRFDAIKHGHIRWWCQWLIFVMRMQTNDCRVSSLLEVQSRKTKSHANQSRNTHSHTTASTHSHTPLAQSSRS